MNKTLKIVCITLLYIGIFLIQLLFVNNISLFSYKPNLIISLIVVSLMLLGIKKGIAISVIFGALLDIMYLSNGFGIYTFSYTVVSLGILAIIRGKIKYNISSVIYLSVISTAIFELIMQLRLILVYKVEIGVIRLISGIVMQSLLNIAFTICIYIIVSKILNKRDNTLNLYN